MSSIDEANSSSSCLFVKLADAAETMCVGKVLFTVLSRGFPEGRVVSVFLRGDLGMGKTTLTKAFLRSAGYGGNVKSPTYTIVEPYDLGLVQVNHFDLYRLGDPEELEFLGFRDYFELPKGAQEKQFCIIEWPEKGVGFLPKPDLELELTYLDAGRSCKFVGAEELLVEISEQCEHFGLTVGGSDGDFF
jgi:tRNA threonylcarbamoyladenosine biosynthesis protein TsaE